MAGLKTQVQKAQAGELKAFRVLVEHYWDMVFAYAYGRLGDYQLAEDAAQEAFLHAWICLGQFHKPAAFAAWLRRITHKFCDRIYRPPYQRYHLLDDLDSLFVEEVSPEHQLLENEQQDLVTGAIALLPQHQRTVVQMYYIGQHSQAEIAAFLGIPIKTVKNRLYASRKILKDKFEKMGISSTYQKRSPHTRDSPNV